MWLGMEIGEDYGMIYGTVMVLYKSYILILIVLQSKKMHLYTLPWSIWFEEGLYHGTSVLYVRSVIGNWNKLIFFQHFTPKSCGCGHDLLRWTPKVNSEFDVKTYYEVL